MAKVDEPKDNQKKGNEKKENSTGGLMGKVLRLSFRTLFILLLIVIFVAGGCGLNIVLSSFKDAPDFDPRNFQQPLTSYIYDMNEIEVARLHDGHNRIEMPLREMPLYLQQAFIAIEDESFYDHIGISPKDIIRAAYNNFRKRDLTDHGGSTITQQLIKNAFLTPDKNYTRKLQEAWLAIKMEQQFSKEEILEFYLNIIYFDYQNYGVQAAAQDYFEKDVGELSLAEAAMLAGIPRNPGFYSPRRNFQESKKRQELVLNQMVEYNYISQQEADKAKKEEIEIFPSKRKSYDNPYFIDYVELEARRILADLDIYEDPYLAMNRGGLKIYTTLEPEIQKIVEDVLDNEKYYPRTIEDEKGKLQPQAAAVLAEPETGHIKALVGGRDYGLHNQDLRYLSERQPGSSTKPVLGYAPAFEENLLFPGSVLDDAPTAFGNYFPENYGLTFQGLMTVRHAVARSRNVPAVKAYEIVTPEVGMAYAEKLGITTFRPQDEGGLALVLGGFTTGVMPIDMAQVFAVFANKGVKIPITTILHIEDHQGKEIYSYRPKSEVVLSEVTSFLITDVLRDVTRGIGTAARLSAVGRPIAGKTGTTSDNKDGWMVSYTPDYVLSTWIGYDLLTMGSIDGAPGYCVSMSIDIMKQVHEGLPVRNFESPGGISRVSICTKSGHLPSEHCPAEHIASELFPRGYEPKETCNVHVAVEVCAESGLLAGEYCPNITIQYFFQRVIPFIATDHRWRGAVGRIPADAGDGSQPPTETCNIHDERSLAPVGLSLSSNPEGNQVHLTWSYPSAHYFGFNIYRSTDNVNFQRLNGNIIHSNSFTDSTTAPQTTYYYRIMAVNEHGVESQPLHGSITTTKETPTPPPDPDPPVEPDPDPPVDPPIDPPDNGNGNDNGDENGNGNGSGNR
ncbi:transglycosylase domain-containing protein [Candidatus Contubernalis alkaliaceticus]|uniref:transglycosylase domain-containing protein n=1 Tax=Candidatus Contubernalis alkaliaceticus TaxID=338645 RepID=UPI001F4C4EB1|nr:penicillin-binding protein 1A [Candidatus Contubernalis alkalaceticus]UNC92639.1 PBP1A family penicillin-binding protein [Candidatus Contubernalis alkalaceticus]